MPLVYATWVKMAFYSIFGCHCEVFVLLRSLSIFYTLIWVRPLFYTKWVKVSFYSRFRCYCGRILFYSKIWVIFNSSFWVTLLFYTKWVKLPFYSTFRCYCGRILFYSKIWVIFTHALGVIVDAFFTQKFELKLRRHFLQCEGIVQWHVWRLAHTFCIIYCQWTGYMKRYVFFRHLPRQVHKNLSNFFIILYYLGINNIHEIFLSTLQKRGNSVPMFYFLNFNKKHFCP